MIDSRYFADLSSNNAAFDGARYRAAGHIIVAIKATEGTQYVNPRHRSWCLSAGLHHVAVVHYHFARPDLDNSPASEAAHFLSVAHPLTGGRDYLALDIERATPQGWSHDPAWSREFDAYIQGHSRFHCVLYSSRAVLQGSSEWLHGDRRRVWDAAYSTEPDFAPPGYECIFRQFTDGHVGPEPHSLLGVEGFCDVNYMTRSIFNQIAARA